MDIKCRKTSCRHNDRETCMAKFVNISMCANCNSFVRGGEDIDYSSRMFEAAPEYHNSRHILDVHLKCDKASCLFNEACHCNANGITVIDNLDMPECGTFIQKEPKY